MRWPNPAGLTAMFSGQRVRVTTPGTDLVSSITPFPSWSSAQVGTSKFCLVEGSPGQTSGLGQTARLVSQINVAASTKSDHIPSGPRPGPPRELCLTRATMNHHITCGTDRVDINPPWHNSSQSSIHDPVSLNPHTQYIVQQPRPHLLCGQPQPPRRGWLPAVPG